MASPSNILKNPNISSKQQFFLMLMFDIISHKPKIKIKISISNLD
jgi:hypothetical protein